MTRKEIIESLDLSAKASTRTGRPRVDTDYGLAAALIEKMEAALERIAKESGEHFAIAVALDALKE